MARGIAIDPNMVAAVREWATPTNPLEVKVFTSNGSMQADYGR